MAAGIVAHPENYPWSSARAHLAGQDDQLVEVTPLLEPVGSWKTFLSLPLEEEIAMIRKHERTGRPLGKEIFVKRLETELADC